MDYDRLADLLAKTHAGAGDRLPTFFVSMAKEIREHPQAHVDALVEAGLLEHIDVPSSQGAHPNFLYRVVVPHVHEWVVMSMEHGGVSLHLGCRTCFESRGVANRLPLEIPS